MPCKKFPVIYSNLTSEGRLNIRAFVGHDVEIVPLSKHFAKYELSKNKLSNVSTSILVVS